MAITTSPQSMAFHCYYWTTIVLYLYFMQTMKYELCFNQREALKTTPLTSAEAKISQIGPFGNQTVPYGDWNKTFIATWHSNVKVNLWPNVSLSLKQTH